jgi:hypothetical protein
MNRPVQHQPAAEPNPPARGQECINSGDPYDRSSPSPGKCAAQVRRQLAASSGRLIFNGGLFVAIPPVGL